MEFVRLPYGKHAQLLSFSKGETDIVCLPFLSSYYQPSLGVAGSESWFMQTTPRFWCKQKVQLLTLRAWQFSTCI